MNEKSQEIQSLLTLITKLAKDLASELDLHYEDSDMFALTPSVTILKEASKTLTAQGAKTPDVVKSVISRYQRNSN